MKYLLTFITFTILIYACAQSHDKHHSDVVKTQSNKGSIISQKLKVSDTLNKHCNIYYLMTLESHLENPSDKEIENFLLTFDASCQTNAEYSEYSNELLFNLLHKFPDKLISILKKNNNIHFRYILKELQKPVNDGIEIDEIVKQIQSRKDTIAIKILQALDKIQ